MSVLHVVLQYCNHPDPARQREFDERVLRNLNNPQVIAVHNLVENGVAVPDSIESHPKYRHGRATGWLTFSEALRYANEGLTGEIVALINLDIFLGEEGLIGRQLESLSAALDPKGGVVPILPQIVLPKDEK